MTQIHRVWPLFLIAGGLLLALGVIDTFVVGPAESVDLRSRQSELQATINEYRNSVDPAKESESEKSVVDFIEKHNRSIPAAFDRFVSIIGLIEYTLGLVLVVIALVLRKSSQRMRLERRKCELS